MSNTPPFQEPWKFDTGGRMVSEGWILWLLQLSKILDESNDDAMITAVSNIQGEQLQRSTKNEDDEILIWLSF